MTTWLVPYADLTPEQRDAVELSPSEHRLIFGPPGSGKTQVLVHRARHLRDLWKVPPDRFRIFVYTNLLKAYIKAGLDTLGLGEASVTTFDAWCREFHERHISNHVPWDKAGRCPDFGAIRGAVHTFLAASTPAVPSPFDFVLVDEAQDLDKVSFDILRRISRHVTVCLDPNQQIYSQGSSEAEVLKQLGLHKRNKSLLGAYRCSPYIFNLAAHLLKDPAERKVFMAQACAVPAEKEKPLLFLTPEFKAEKQRLIDVVRTRLAVNDRIAILFPQKRLVYGFAEGLREVGLEVETPDNMDMASEKPKLIPYHSVKGLTFDTVLLPMLKQRYVEQVPVERLERLLFVAITRATKWVYLSGSEESLIGTVRDLRDAAAGLHLTVQSSPGSPGRLGVASPSQDDPATDAADGVTDLL